MKPILEPFKGKLSIFRLGAMLRSDYRQTGGKML
jgi:hypothetical protein